MTMNQNKISQKLIIRTIFRTIGFAPLQHSCFFIIIYSNLIHKMRKIEGDGTIQRPEEYQYSNAIYLPHERTVNSVNYYTRRKKQLKRNPSSEVIINLSSRNAERSDLRNHIQTLFKSSKSIDPFISNYIKEIRVDPVINDNKFTNFNEELYPLNEDEKVKVLEQRYFPLQNYYNYIYDLQLKKELSRFVIEAEQKATVVVKDNKNNGKLLLTEQSELGKGRNSLLFQDIVQQRERSSIKDKKIKGYYESRFVPKVKNTKKDNSVSIKQLHEPEEIIFQSNLRFSVSQNKRLQLSIQRQ